MSKILIIDDSSFARMKLISILKKKNYEIIEADDGDIGLKIAEDEKPDCIILDLLMPSIDGFEFLEIANEKSLNIPIIILTSDNYESTEIFCKQNGAFEVIIKPYQASNILNVIEKALLSK